MYARLAYDKAYGMFDDYSFFKIYLNLLVLQHTYGGQAVHGISGKASVIGLMIIILHKLSDEVALV